MINTNPFGKGKLYDDFVDRLNKEEESVKHHFNSLVQKYITILHSIENNPNKFFLAKLVKENYLIENKGFPNTLYNNIIHAKFREIILKLPPKARSLKK